MSDVPLLPQSVVLITGASTGIGAALARQLANRYPGIRLVLAARTREKLYTVAADCQQAGATVLVVPTDLTQIEQAQALAQKALDHFGLIHALINNAGYGQMGPLELMTPEECRRQFEVNVMGPLALTQAVIPGMRDRGGGRIINISSIGGRTAFPFGGLYSGSKFALEAISDALRMELEPFNIKVSVVEPGAVHNEFLDVVKQEIEAAVPNPQATPYRAAFAIFGELAQRTKATAWTSDQVAAVIIKVLNAKQPRPRYVAATAGSFLVFMLTKVLPTKAVDRFWQRFYGINLVAKEWRQQKQI